MWLDGRRPPAYTLALGLDEGWLVYGNAPDQESRVHEIASAGERFVVSALDVGIEPEQLLEQVDDLAAAVAASSQPLPVAA